MQEKFYSSKYFKWVIKCAVSIFFVAYVIRKLDIYALWLNIKNYPVYLLIVALLLMILNVLVGAVSLHALYKNESIWDMFAITLKSSFYSLILPGQSLGESTKILMMSSEKGKLSQRISAVFVDKLLNVYALFVLGTVGSFFTKSIESKVIKLLFGISALGLTILGVIGSNVRSCTLIERKVDNSFASFPKLKNSLKKGINIWIGYITDKKGMMISMLCGFIYHIIISLVYWVLARGLALHISLLDIYWINGLLTFILLFPISIGGLGIREVSLVGMLGLLEVRENIAFSLSLLILLVQVLRAMLGGVFIIFGNINLKKS